MKILVRGTEVFTEDDEFLKELKGQITFRTRDVSEDDVAEADVIIGNVSPKLLDKAKKLKYMHLLKAGSDEEAAALRGRDVILTNSTGCFSLSIAENILAMILYFYKNLRTYNRYQDKHIYRKLDQSRSIYGSKILVIGAGSIGLAFAQRAAALGAEVTGIKRTPGTKPEYLKALYTNEMVEQCLPLADIIVMSLPQSAATFHFMNEERMKLIKPGALLINVGRGSAVDTAALIPLLIENRFSAALDVFEIEPLPAESELWDLENCLILPHTTGSTNLWYSREMLHRLAVTNLRNYLEGKPLENIVDLETGYKISNS